MSLCPTILIVEDEKNSREGLRQFLETLDYDVVTAGDGESGWRSYLEERPDIVLADIRMPGMDGSVLLEKIKAHRPETIVILITAYGTVDDAVKAMKKGAFYYLTKPVNLEELEFLVKKAITSIHLEEENRELKKELFTEKYEQGEILAQSKIMRDLLKTVDQIAQSQSTVLIEGESGTGKELVAHRIHQLSARSQKPFVAVHCAALTETLLSSELFGHEKGAFTGATERKIGRFERAHEGTLFLDEIGEISSDTQLRLLRVLQESEFERVGGTRTIKVNVRIISATNKKLQEQVRLGKFREDLFYRLNVILLRVPPLRERQEDIPPMIESFITHFSKINGKRISGISKEAIDVLTQYPWPGNVRELKNIIERMVVLTVSPYLDLSNVPAEMKSQSGLSLIDNGSKMVQNVMNCKSIGEMERQMIEKAISEAGGNKSLAAKRLGISRRTLYRKLDEYGIKG